MVILDTNIIIDHLRQKERDTALIKAAKEKTKKNLSISTITIQELYEGKSTIKQNEEEYLLATITPLNILSYNYEIAQTAGKIARDLNKPIELADAAIAATAIVNEASLYTLNKKDFVEIPNLELINFE